MVKIAVAGAAGRMGSRITALSTEYKELKLVGETGVTLVDNLESIIDSVDLVISFTTVEASKEHLRIASKHEKAMVIGTTGFTKDDLKEVHRLTKKIPCVMASNMSMGVNLLLRVLQDIAKVLGDAYDVEIIEAHHKMKKDAPSGTALKMAENQQRNWDTDNSCW
jgi:4-hydroxy-tetrahydrodipicolinate reductase